MDVMTPSGPDQQDDRQTTAKSAVEAGQQSRRKMTEAGVCGEEEKPISVAAAAKSYGLGE